MAGNNTSQQGRAQLRFALQTRLMHMASSKNTPSSVFGENYRNETRTFAYAHSLALWLLAGLLLESLGEQGREILRHLEEGGDAAEMQRRCSRGAVQRRCSGGAAEVQRGCSGGAAEVAWRYAAP